jgi:hypothetical protein
MCYHHRILYGGCNHSAWLGKVRSCEIEQGFEAGLTNEGCGWMFAHPLKTTRLSGLCPDCDKKKTWSAAKLGKIKALLKTLQEDMARRRSTGDDCSDQTTEVASGSDSPGSSGITAGVAGTEVAGLEMAPDAYEEASGVETGGIIEVSNQPLFHALPPDYSRYPSTMTATAIRAGRNSEITLHPSEANSRPC